MPVYSECPHDDCQRAVESRRGGNGEGPAEEGKDARSRRGSQDGRISPASVYNPYYTGRPRSSQEASRHSLIDRQEIIRKIKSRENGSRPSSPELERPSSAVGRKLRSPTTLHTPIGPVPIASPRSRSSEIDNHAAGMQIERPRSALHRGDFNAQEGSNQSRHGRFADVSRDEQIPSLSTSPVAPWHPQFPAAAFRQAWLERRQLPPQPPSIPLQAPAKPRAVSNASLSSSFTYQPPTSPLVHQSRPDTPETGNRRRSRSPDKSRRHTFSPQALQGFSALNYPSSARSQAKQATPSMRKEGTYPYQAHQPRRSLHSFHSLPQTPAAGSWKPSVSDSPLQHAPMVGSYEESILRGRMSTTPSKPLNFVAQIGVLGKGQCGSKLKCPPHAVVPFPAVFYSYGNRGGGADDQPSPYVGLVDLENNLPSADISSGKRLQRIEKRLQAALSDEGSRASSQTREDGSASDGHAKRRRRQKQKRRSGSPKAPPGGSYRIPQQGQLQIVLKNPNKTAVKLFLIPYDLSDMEPGQKTFIRQRSYSAGPIIDMPLNSRPNLGTDRPEAALSTSEDPNDRPMLRYLVHLHICSPSKGRFFLYKSIRVVFANRVPDGKEKLRNEIQLPEPKYTAYKPGRESTGGSVSNSATPNHRRRSSVFDHMAMNTETRWPATRQSTAQSLPSTDFNGPVYSMPSAPFHFPSVLPTLESRPASRQTFSSDIMDVDSQRSEETRGTLSPISSSGMLSPVISRDDPGPGDGDEPFLFERDRDRGRMLVDGVKNESLLSRRLRGLAFQGQDHGRM